MLNGNNKKHRMKFTKRLLALIFLVVGVIGWLIPPFDILNYPQVELPNSHPQGLFIDGNGNIFCGSRTYERIQMYDKEGNFVRGFDTDVGEGRGCLFTFKVDNGQLHIHVYGAWLKSKRLDRMITYALDGNLLQAKEVPSAEYAGYNVSNETYDSLGIHYIFKGLLWPHVIKNSKEDGTVIIGTPFYFWLLQSPFPAFAFFFIALLYLAGFKNLFRKRQNKSETSKAVP